MRWRYLVLLCSGNLLKENVWEWILLVPWGKQHILLFLVQHYFLAPRTGCFEKLIFIMQALDFARIIFLISSGKSHVWSPWIFFFLFRWFLFLNDVSIFPSWMVSFVFEIVTVMIGWIILFVLISFLLTVIVKEVEEVLLLGWSEDVPIFGLVVFRSGVGWIHLGRIIWYVLKIRWLDFIWILTVRTYLWMILII